MTRRDLDAFRWALPPLSSPPLNYRIDNIYNNIFSSKPLSLTEMSMDTTTEEPRRVCYVVSNELVKVGPEYL